MGFFKNLFGGKKDDGFDDEPYVSDEMIEREDWSKDQWVEFVHEDWNNIWELDSDGQKCNQFDKNELLNEIKNDKELAKKLLKENGSYLSDFGDEIKNDKELVIIAVSPKEGGAPAHRFASEELKSDPDVIEATKKGNLDIEFDEDEGISLYM